MVILIESLQVATRSRFVSRVKSEMPESINTRAEINIGDSIKKVFGL